MLSVFLLVPSINQCVIVLLVILLSSDHFGIHLNGHRTLSSSSYASQMYYNLHLHTLHFLKFRNAQNKLYILRILPVHLYFYIWSTSHFSIISFLFENHSISLSFVSYILAAFYLVPLVNSHNTLYSGKQKLSFMHLLIFRSISFKLSFKPIVHVLVVFY